ncbi:UNVERIFIED_CONTAM: hypothetical protein NCL1_21742 [Trichonephila clavipes]
MFFSVICRNVPDKAIRQVFTCIYPLIFGKVLPFELILFDSHRFRFKTLVPFSEMLLYILKRTENIFSEAKGKLLPDSPSFDEGLNLLLCLNNIVAGEIFVGQRADRVGILLSLKSGLRTTRLFLVDAVSKIIKKTPNEIIDIVISTFTDTCEHNLRRCSKSLNQYQKKDCFCEVFESGTYKHLQNVDSQTENQVSKSGLCSSRATESSFEKENCESSPVQQKSNHTSNCFES